MLPYALYSDSAQVYSSGKGLGLHRVLISVACTDIAAGRKERAYATAGWLSTTLDKELNLDPTTLNAPE